MATGKPYYLEGHLKYLKDYLEKEKATCTSRPSTSKTSQKTVHVPLSLSPSLHSDTSSTEEELEYADVLSALKYIEKKDGDQKEAILKNVKQNSSEKKETMQENNSQNEEPVKENDTWDMMSETEATDCTERKRSTCIIRNL